MKSRRYCPNCGSFDLRRIKRSVLQKYIIRRPPHYQCIHCNTTASQKRIDKNEPLQHPGIYHTQLLE